MEAKMMRQESAGKIREPPGAPDVRTYLFSPCELRHLALEYICGKGSGFVLVGAANELPESPEALATIGPDLVIVDAELLVGSRPKAVTALLQEMHRVARVIILAGHLDIAQACAAIANGADGYVLTSVPIDELLQALHVVAAGGVWLGQDLARAIAGHFAEPHQEDAAHIARLLSQRERQILNGVARGETSKEIAKELFLSESSVRTYWYRVLGKLNALNKAEAVARAVRLGLLDADAGEEETLLVPSPRLRTLLHERTRRMAHE
jgi:two-component system nitrate/nitrite response regulator NarL